MKRRLGSVPLLMVGLISVPFGSLPVVSAAKDVTKLEGVEVTAESIMSVERPSGVVDREFRVKGRVNYSDLDLGTEAGKKELESRIKRVAADVCTELDKVLPARTLEHGNCVRESVDRAMAGVKTR